MHKRKTQYNEMNYKRKIKDFMIAMGPKRLL
jgi:hypothetical protein